MVIKKPYAFLIKHFKMIHLFLFSCVSFIAYKSYLLYKFFNDYVKNGFYSYSDNLSTKYIDYYMFMVLIVIILLGLVVYVLLRWKEKKRTLYVFLCSFYLILFISLIFYFNILLTIQNDVIDNRTIRLYRDILFIVNLPQYFFVILTLIRGVGFDIKKFNFSKDLEELQIEKIDYEEIEITVGKENYKFFRRIRRLLREFKYYVLENKFFFGVICSLILVSFGFYLYLNTQVYHKEYSENDLFIVDGVSFNLVNSYASNVDYKGNFINPNKEYVIVKLEMKNNTDAKKILNTEDLRLVANSEEYLPVFSKNNHFIDIGEGYFKQTLYPGEEYEYMLVFEIPKEIVTRSYTFRMINRVDYLKGEINANHKDVKIVPIYMDYENETETFSVGDILDLSESTLRKSSIQILNYDFNDEYTYTYEYFVSGQKYNGKKIIKVDPVGKIPYTVMRLEVKFENNDQLYINKFLKSNSDFIKMFGKINYRLNGIVKNSQVDVIAFDYLKGDYVYVAIPKEISIASDINFVINVRNKVYTVILKGSAL